MTAANQQLHPAASPPRAPRRAAPQCWRDGRSPGIGFGVMQLERSGRRARDAALAILRQAAGAGVNHIDTAHFYGGANGLIRDALHPAPYPGDLVLVTKVECGAGTPRRQAHSGAAPP